MRPVALIHDEPHFPHSRAPVVVGVDGSPASELATAIAFDERPAGSGFGGPARLVRFFLE